LFGGLGTGASAPAGNLGIPQLDHDSKVLAQRPGAQASAPLQVQR
jgi:hypothetical protein